MTDDPRDRIRRAAGWALIVGLSIAALTAVVALLAGDFGDGEARVILTSIGFAICSTVAASGANLRFRGERMLRGLGTATALLSGATFVLLVAGLWTHDWGTDAIWRGFGCAALLAVAGSHAGIVLGARRRTDSEIVTTLVIISLVLAGIDTFGALLPISGLVEEVDEALEDTVEKAFAVTLVLLVLTTLLPPLMRRLLPSPTRSTTARGEPVELLAEELVTIADRIDDLARGPALRTPEIRREAERLRNLARSFQP